MGGEKMIITIDPGHGGSDPGAVGPAGTQEKEHALTISLYVRDLLQEAGHEVVMTRETDIDVAEAGATAGEELGARVDIANLAAADVFISIHINAADNQQAQGAETWYYMSGMDLARYIQAEIVQLGLDDRGVKQGNFYVLKHTDMPAILVELAFISNPEEEVLLSGVDFRRQAAKCITDGLQRWLNEN
jgi:N-acetylmuramoyl-L-alanine amidase